MMNCEVEYIYIYINEYNVTTAFPTRSTRLLHFVIFVLGLSSFLVRQFLALVAFALLAAQGELKLGSHAQYTLMLLVLWVFWASMLLLHGMVLFLFL